MDRKLSQIAEIQRLVRHSELSRSLLATEIAELKGHFNIVERMRTSFKSNPVGWLVGSLSSGLALSMLFRKRGPVVAVEKKSGGLILTVLGLALTTFRPFAKDWISKQVTTYFAGRPVVVVKELPPGAVIAPVSQINPLS